MKKLVFVLLVSLCSLTAFAARQDITIKGSVCDRKTSEPLEWVTIAVRDAEGSVIAGTTTDENGNFNIAVPNGSIITASLMGYQDATAQPEKEMIIYLDADSEQLAAATVTEKVKLVEVKLDKIVMNVSQSAFSQGSNGLDLLKKAPGVVIDNEGNIKLNGKAVSIWIDGRPSNVDGKSLEALLRSTDGSTIDKFEIMEHPSSKYDAQGQGGIINIKTKRSFAAGFNGNIGIHSGGMYFKEYDFAPWEESAWANLSYRGKKTNTFLNISQSRYQQGLDFTSKASVETPAGTLTQETFARPDMRFYNYNIKLGNDWFIDDRNTIGFIFSMPAQYDNQYTGDGKNGENHFLNGVLLKSLSGFIDEKENQVNLSGNLNYTHIFDPSRSAEITTNIDYYSIANNKTTDEEMIKAGTGVPCLTRYILTDNAVNIWSAKSDYQSLLWQKVMFEAGLKGAVSSTGSTTDQKETGEEAYNDYQNFTYLESIGAAYFNAATQLGPKWALKAGLRAEYTYSFGDWISSNDKTERSYINLFPTVFVGFNPNDNWRFGLSYTRRINRPSYFYLNPNKSFVGTNSYAIGNPDLMPEFSDDVSLSVGFGQHLNFAAGYSHISNWIMQNPYIDEQANQIYKWDNYGDNNTLFTTFSLSQQPIFKWLDLTLNLAGLYMTTQAIDASYDTKCFTFNAYGCFTFNLPKEWKIEWAGSFTSPMKLAYMNSKPQWTADISLRKLLLGGRMTLTAGLNDIFRSYGFDFTTDASRSGNNSSSEISQKFLNQKLSFGISWNFGTAQSPLRTRNVGNLEEASRAKSGGGLGN